MTRCMRLQEDNEKMATLIYFYLGSLKENFSSHPYRDLPEFRKI